jgi:hypothetical protein
MIDSPALKADLTKLVAMHIDVITQMEAGIPALEVDYNRYMQRYVNSPIEGVVVRNMFRNRVDMIAAQVMESVEKHS